MSKKKPQDAKTPADDIQPPQDAVVAETPEEVVAVEPVTLPQHILDEQTQRDG